MNNMRRTKINYDEHHNIKACAKQLDIGIEPKNVEEYAQDQN